MVVLAAGLFLKGSCGQDDSRQAPTHLYCYTDIWSLYVERGLEARAPYFDAPVEYPVGTGITMAAAATVSATPRGFFVATVSILMSAAIVIVVLLYELVGARALYFALAPTLLIWGFVNWDLLAVLLATAATSAFLRKRNGLCGVFLGLGAAMKVYPVLLLLPFVRERVRVGERRGASRLTVATVLTLLAANLPFALLAFDGWARFFKLNASRPPDWGTLWSVGCQILGDIPCNVVPLVNVVSFGLLVSGSAVVWGARVARDPETPRWTFGMVLVIVFLLTNKVFSPQYSLWLLPWFALVLPDVRLFVAFEAADLAVFVTHFGWQERLSGLGGMPLWALDVAGVARAVVLVIMLVRFARSDLPARVPMGRVV